MKKIPERNEIAQKDKWAIEDLYASPDLWQEDLKKLQIIEKVIREPESANEENLPEIAEEIRKDLDGFLRKSCQKTREQIVEERYERFRRM